MTCEIRPSGSGEHAVIRKVFWETIVMGRPLPFDLRDADRYERLALDWYLHHEPESARIATVDGRIAGYVLVCTDQVAFDRWMRKEAARYTAAVVAGLFRGRYPGPSGRFYRLRLADGWDAWRGANAAPTDAHAHLNLSTGFRSGLIIRSLIEHVEAVCLSGGITEWTGQMNALPGRRVRVLEAYGFRVVDARLNRTLTWLCGERVLRLTLHRRVGRLERSHRPIAPIVAGRERKTVSQRLDRRPELLAAPSLATHTEEPGLHELTPRHRS
jgi:hypothetical protein